MVEMGDEACAPEAESDALAVSQEKTPSKRKLDSDATSRCVCEVYSWYSCRRGGAAAYGSVRANRRLTLCDAHSVRAIHMCGRRVALLCLARIVSVHFPTFLTSNASTARELLLSHPVRGSRQWVNSSSARMVGHLSLPQHPALLPHQRHRMELRQRAMQRLHSRTLLPPVTVDSFRHRLSLSTKSPRVDSPPFMNLRTGAATATFLPWPRSMQARFGCMSAEALSTGCRHTVFCLLDHCQSAFNMQVSPPLACPLLLFIFSCPRAHALAHMHAHTLNTHTHYHAHPSSLSLPLLHAHPYMHARV